MAACCSVTFYFYFYSYVGGDVSGIFHIRGFPPTYLLMMILMGNMLSCFTRCFVATATVTLNSTWATHFQKQVQHLICFPIKCGFSIFCKSIYSVAICIFTTLPDFFGNRIVG